MISRKNYGNLTTKRGKTTKKFTTVISMIVRTTRKMWPHPKKGTGPQTQLFGTG